MNELVSMQTPLMAIVAALYLASLFLPARRAGYIAILLAWMLHGAVLASGVFSEVAIRLGFAIVLSATLWMSVLAYLVENRQGTLDSMRVLVLPFAAVAVVLPHFFPGSLVMLADKSDWFVWHIIVSVLAYSTLTIAAFHAVLMVLQEARLHPRKGILLDQGWFGVALDRLPALLTMEKMLFRLIAVGFVLLTLTLFSGVVFSEELLGRALVWDHKTVFSLLSWVLFGALLAGRRWQGWRGRTALRVTLAGFLVLLLGYIGSRFVLEVVLHKVLIT